MQNLVEKAALKKWQDKFCSATNVYAYCLDQAGHPITEMSGRKEDTDNIKQIISENQFLSIYKRVSEGNLEEQAVEYTSVPNLRLAAISVKLEEEAFVWIVCSILTDADHSDYEQDVLEGLEYEVTEKEFYSALDLLRDTTYTIFRNIYSMSYLEEQVKSCRNSELEIGADLKRSEAIAEIIQLLECDDTMEMIMADVLRIIGTYLNISMAVLCHAHKDEDAMDIVTQWHHSGMVSQFDKTKDIPCSVLFKADKVIVLSSGASLSPEEEEGIQFFDAKALIVVPMVIAGETSRYACFGENNKERQWQLDDVKFINDAVKILQSIIIKRMQKNSLVNSYDSLVTILDNIGCSIYVRDMHTEEILFANRWLRNNFTKELEQKTLHLLFEQEITEDNKRGQQEIYHEERACWYDLYYTYITWVDGRPVTLFSVYDITEKKMYQKRIEQQAYTDSLTGLYNRLCCEKDLARYVDAAKKHKSKGALLYLDLDDFKHINDGLGHQYGDVLLKEISHNLQRVNAIENTCYRVGGDEFIIIIPPNSYSKYEQIINEIRKIFAKPWFLKDADYYCTMSMGVVNFPEEGRSVHDLIKKADIAMYEAKKLGKNRVAVYTDKMDPASSRRLDMEKNMRDAATSGYKEFEVYFQPIIDIQLPGTPCTGAEALMRWNSEELGFISPKDFIPLAEYLGLIIPIGEYVLRESCLHCKKWNDSGHPNYKVNVNLSVIQLLQADIVEIIAKTLKETKLYPRNLTLEVTESLAINDMERMKEILGRIKKLGVRIALDDFGTGYSSLNHIREIPFDVIKVDQSFVRELADDAYSQSFIRMVGELAGAIGVSICVEGIETKEQYKILEDMKVRLVQGYYFDRPMPRNEFEKRYVYY